MKFNKVDKLGGELEYCVLGFLYNEELLADPVFHYQMPYIKVGDHFDYRGFKGFVDKIFISDKDTLILSKNYSKGHMGKIIRVYVDNKP